MEGHHAPCHVEEDRHRTNAELDLHVNAVLGHQVHCVSKYVVAYCGYQWVPRDLVVACVVARHEGEVEGEQGCCEGEVDHEGIVVVLQAHRGVCEGEGAGPCVD